MTQEQFIHWLDGFLDGKEVSQNQPLKRIKEKFEQVKSVSTFQNQYAASAGTTNPYSLEYNPSIYVTTSSGTPTTTKSDGSNEKQLLTDIKNEGL